jgi:hypothetical protein
LGKVMVFGTCSFLVFSPSCCFMVSYFLIFICICSYDFLCKLLLFGVDS